MTEALRLQFRPEFLNRVDEVIVFHALTDADLAAIVEPAPRRPRSAGWPPRTSTLELTPAARALIVREGTDPAFGARPLKRTIQRLVENPLARALVAGAVQAGRPDRRPTPTSRRARSSSRPRARRSSPTASTRRDARTPVGAGAGAAPAVARPEASSPLDLPPTDREARTTASSSTDRPRRL